MASASLPHWLDQTPHQFLDRHNAEENTTYHTLGLDIFISRPGEFLVDQAASATGSYSVPTTVFADPSGALRNDPDTIRDLIIKRLKVTLSDQAFRTAQLMDYWQNQPIFAVTQTSSTKLDLSVTVTVNSVADQNGLMWITSRQAQSVNIPGQTMGATTANMTRVVVSYSDFSRAVTRLDHSCQKESIQYQYDFSEVDYICTMMLTAIITIFEEAVGVAGCGSILVETSPSGKAILLFRRTEAQLNVGIHVPPDTMALSYQTLGQWRKDGLRWAEFDEAERERKWMWDQNMMSNGRLVVVWR